MRIKARRIGMSVSGVLICGISVGIFRHAALGVDPFQTLMSGLGALVPLGYGALYVLVNLLLLGIPLLLNRRKIGPATLINLFFLGYAAEFSQALCEKLLPLPSLPLRFGLLLFALVILCLSSALYYTADLGVSPYDALALIWSEKQQRLPFRTCRVLCDLGCVLLGTLLGLGAGWSPGQLWGVVGAGTLITAFCMGPLTAFFTLRVARPFLEADAPPKS